MQSTCPSLSFAAGAGSGVSVPFIDLNSVNVHSIKRKVRQEKGSHTVGIVPAMAAAVWLHARVPLCESGSGGHSSSSRGLPASQVPPSHCTECHASA